MGEKELRLALEELDRIEIECPNCRTIAGYPAALQQSPEKRLPEPGETCPGCGLLLDLGGLVRAYRALFAAGNGVKRARVRFHVSFRQPAISEP